METVGIIILAICVVALAGSVLLLAGELKATKRAQRVGIALQLYQQMQTPAIATAIEQVRTLADEPARADLAPVQLCSAQWDALRTVNHYFAHVGELVATGVADDEVFALMGPTISAMWHVARPTRQLIKAKVGQHAPDYFDWLYERWLNWDHWQRAASGE